MVLRYLRIQQLGLHALSGLRFIGCLSAAATPVSNYDYCLAAREDWLFKLLFLISSQMRLSGWSSIVEFLAKHSWRLTAIDSCNVIIINARLLICSFTRFSNCSEKTFLSYSPLYIIKLFVDRSSSTVKVTHWLGEDVAPPIRPRLMALYKCALIDWLIDWLIESILARISVFLRDFSSSLSFAQDFAKPFLRYYSFLLFSLIHNRQQTGYSQGWAQGSFVEAEAEVEADSSRPRRGRLNSRQGRGEATPEKPSFP